MELKATWRDGKMVLLDAGKGQRFMGGVVFGLWEQ